MEKSNPLDIPIGWREIRSNELLKNGDMLFSGGAWHKTEMVGEYPSNYFVYIRALSSDTPPIERGVYYLALTVSVKDKVKAYLKKSS